MLRDKFRLSASELNEAERYITACSKPVTPTELLDVVKTDPDDLPYDEAAVVWHGGERARLESLGRPAPFVDGQIASIAHVHGLVLVTTNDHDFVRFKSLRVENWSKRYVRSKTEAT